jgi:hypothetical protein
MFYAPQTQWKILDGVVVQNILHKETVRTDKISEIVKYSDSNGGSFGELSGSDMCKVNSPFQQQQHSSSEEEEDEVVQVGAGRKNVGPFLNVQIQVLSRMERTDSETCIFWSTRDK